MQSNPKSNSIITSRFDKSRNTLVFTVAGQGDVELDLSKVSPECMARAAIHGWNQRIPDAAAIGTTDADGLVIPKSERTRIKFERMNDLCRYYESGTAEWSRVSAGGVGAQSITVEAFARHHGCTYANAKERIAARAKAAGRTYGKQLSIVRQLFPDDVAAVEAERATRTVPAFDSDAEIEAFKGE